MSFSKTEIIPKVLSEVGIKYLNKKNPTYSWNQINTFKGDHDVDFNTRKKGRDEILTS